jgi:hypothetical protein
LTKIGTGGSSYTPAIPENLNTFSLGEPNTSSNNNFYLITIESQIIQN